MAVKNITEMTQEQLYDHLCGLEGALRSITAQVTATQGWHKYRIEEKILGAVTAKRDEYAAELKRTRDEYTANITALEEIIRSQLEQIRTLEDAQIASAAALEEERSKGTSQLKEAISRTSGEVESAWTRREREFKEFVAAHPNYSTAMLARHFNVSHSTIYNWSHINGHAVAPVHTMDYRRQINGYLGRKPHATPEQLAERFGLPLQKVRDYLAVRNMSVTVDPSSGLVEQVAFG